MDFILTDSIKTPELDTSLDEPDVIISSVSSGFLHLVRTVSDTSKPQFAPSIRSHKLWCQARVILSSVSLVTKMLESKLICYFSNHPAAFGFWSSMPPDNITLNPANTEADQSHSELQTGIDAAAHATLNTEQLIYQIRVALVYTISSLPGEELFLFQKCVNYLSRFMTFWTMLFPDGLELSSYLNTCFYSTSRPHHEVWVPQFSFLLGLKDMVPPSEAYLYCCINWSLAQA